MAFTLIPSISRRLRWPVVRRMMRWILTIIAAAIWLLLVGRVKTYLLQPFPVPVSGKIKRTGSVEVSYALRQRESISPVCGCEEKPDADHWRGITMFARQIKLQGEGHRGVQYFVTPAFPDNFHWEADHRFRFAAQLVHLLIPADSKFDSSVLISGKIPKSYKVVSVQDLDRIALALVVSDEPVNVDMHSKNPFAAWIPTTNSKVVLGYSGSAYANDHGQYSIQEQARSHTSSEDSSAREYPTLDIIGTDSVMWSNDSKCLMIFEEATIPEKKDIPKPKPTIMDNPGFIDAMSSGKPIEEHIVRYSPWPDVPVAEQKITALVITKAPFSTRIALMPYERDFRKYYRNQFKPNFELALYLPFLNGNVSVKATILGMDNSGSEYSRVRNDLMRNDLVWVNDFPQNPGPFLLKERVIDRSDERQRELERQGLAVMELQPIYEELKPQTQVLPNGSMVTDLPPITTLQSYSSMRFRYPPAPENNGFNIFGPVDYLKFASTEGALTIADKSKPIGTAYELELRKIRSQKVDSNSKEIPIPVKIKNDSAEFNVAATAEILIHGRQQSRNCHRYGLTEERVQLICRVAQVGILGIALIIFFNVPLPALFKSERTYTITGGIQGAVGDGAQGRISVPETARTDQED